jgi:hypothetical protein
MTKWRRRSLFLSLHMQISDYLGDDIGYRIYGEELRLIDPDRYEYDNKRLRG